MDVLLLISGTIVALVCDALNNQVSQVFLTVVNLMSMVALALLLLIVFIEIVASMKLAGSTVHTVIIAAMLFFYYLSSTDAINTFQTLGLHFLPDVADIFSFMSFVCLVGSVYYFFNYLYALKMKPPVVLALFIISLTAFLFYVLMQERNLSYIPYIIYIALTLGVFAAMSVIICKRKKDDFTFYMTSFITYSVYGAQTVYVMERNRLINVSTAGYSLVYMFIIVLVFLIIYFYYIIRTTRAALKASEYKLQLNTLKSEVLREQIKPHFIFNSLTAIKSLYHKNLDEGDHAMNLFSRHLRSNVEAADTDLIPFERELDNIENYIELENARYDKKFNVIYDIDITDFSVPVLSLQPFVENAIKYSKVNAKEDGFIEISTSEHGEEIWLEISDNGAGFDESDIKENSYGIRNSRERFKLLMNAEIDIASAKGEGTRVTVRIKKPRADGLKEQK